MSAAHVVPGKATPRGRFPQHLDDQNGYQCAAHPHRCPAHGEIGQAGGLETRIPEHRAERHMRLFVGPVILEAFRLQHHDADEPRDDQGA